MTSLIIGIVFLALAAIQLITQRVPGTTTRATGTSGWTFSRSSSAGPKSWRFWAMFALTLGIGLFSIAVVLTQP